MNDLRRAVSCGVVADPVIEVRSVSRLKLRDASLTVAAGERIAIVGRSGEGKSVLLRLILGLLTADRGEIRLFGERVDEPIEDVAGLGVAFQNPGLLDAWTIRENIEASIGHPLRDEEMAALLERTGLAAVSSEASPRNLSGGQQKRIALLRAVVRANRLLILDEPTSGLDPETSDQIVRFLERELADSPAALFVITHDYDVALRLCQRVLLLSGRGTIEEIPIDRADRAASVERIRAALREQPVSDLVAAGKKVTWGLAHATEDFITQALPVSLGMMVPLGAMLVAQSAGLGPIDISPRIPGGLVAAVFREMAPLVIGLLVSARISSRISAEVAGMSYTAQIDSMRVLGISRRRFLLAPFVVAAALVFPLCTILGGLAAVVGGMLLASAGYRHLTIGASRFLSLAILSVDPLVLGVCLLKGIVTGAAVAAISYGVAAQQITTAADLGRAVTRATILGAVCVIAVDVVFSWLFFS